MQDVLIFTRPHLTKEKQVLSASDPAFVLRIGSIVESTLYVRKWLYVGVRRNWLRGSKVLFVRKSEVFSGSGLVSSVQLLDELKDDEREMCLKQNLYARIRFGTLERFLPPVPVESTPAGPLNPLTLHGAELPFRVASEIENLAACRIIL